MLDHCEAILLNLSVLHRRFCYRATAGRRASGPCVLNRQVERECGFRKGDDLAASSEGHF